MRRVLGACLLLFASGLQARDAGQWSIEVGTHGVSVSMWQRGGGGFFQSSTNVPWASLRGLERDVAMQRDAAVRFEIVRDAGRFTCEGRFDRGKGEGTWTFAPDPSFEAQMARRGYRGSRRRRSSRSACTR